jgi:hypothetical protein
MKPKYLRGKVDEWRMAESLAFGAIKLYWREIENDANDTKAVIHASHLLIKQAEYYGVSLKKIIQILRSLPYVSKDIADYVEQREMVK